MNHPVKNFDRILIAVDESSFSENAVRYGYHLAELMGASVALVHVIDPPSAASYGSDPIVGQHPIVLPQVTEIQEQQSGELLERLSIGWTDKGRLHIFQKMGHPRTEILETANEWNADLIILGTHGRTGFDHFISGSVAEGVARRSVCPVLIVPNKTEEE